jgi:hypothetical protein
VSLPANILRFLAGYIFNRSQIGTALTHHETFGTCHKFLI